MKSSIYISSDEIQVIGYSAAGGAVRINDYVTCPLAEGTMINGKIIDPAHLTECLENMRRESPGLFAGPDLVVDGSSIYMKKIFAPKMKKSKYIRFLREKFSDITDNYEDLVCDYYTLGSSEGRNTIMAAAADKTLTEGYISAFSDAGIKLSSIKIGMQAIFNYVGSNPGFRDKACVINVIDGLTMVSMIFQSGINVFVSRTRLYGEEHEQVLQTILSNLSGLIQFNKSEKFDDLTHSYYLGLSRGDLKTMNALNPFPEIELEVPDIFAKHKGIEKLSINTHFAYLNIAQSRSGIDLIGSLKMLERLKKQERPKKLWIPVVACLCTLFLAAAAYLGVQLIAVNRDAAEIRAYLTNPENAAREAEIDRIAEETVRYSGLVNIMQAISDVRNVDVSNEVMDLITQTHRDTVRIIKIEYTENTQSLEVNADSATEVDSAEYVDALKESPLVESIVYTGYHYTRSGEYNFSINVRLSG